MDWFDVGYKPEYDPAKIDKNVKLLRNTVEKNNIKFTQELDLIDGKFDQTLSVDGAVSLFRQEARKFTFEADQINFEGHVFGENASFAGKLEGASFLSKISDTNYTLIENNNIHSEGNYWDDRGGNGDGKVNMYGIFKMNNGKFTLESGQILSNGNRTPTMTEVGIDVVGFYVNDEGGGGTYIGNGGDIGFGGWHDSDSSTARIYSFGNNLHIHANDTVNVNGNEFNSNGEIFSIGTRNNEVTWSGRAAVANNTGRFGFVSSSRRFKLNIDGIKSEPYSILDVNPSSWYDKNNTEHYADLLTKKYNGEDVDVDDIDDDIRRIPGLIAEEVEKAGLGEFVTYRDGEIDGVMYDRIPILFIPILRDHEDKINKLLKRKQSHKRKIKRNKIKYRRSVSL